MADDVVRALGHLALGTRLKRIGERLQAQTQRVLDAHELGIQAAQFPFLAAIDRIGPATVGELAEAVGVTQPDSPLSTSRALSMSAFSSKKAKPTHPSEVGFSVIPWTITLSLAEAL